MLFTIISPARTGGVAALTMRHLSAETIFARRCTTAYMFSGVDFLSCKASVRIFNDYHDRIAGTLTCLQGMHDALRSLCVRLVESSAGSVGLENHGSVWLQF